MELQDRVTRSIRTRPVYTMLTTIQQKRPQISVVLGFCYTVLFLFFLFSILITGYFVVTYKWPFPVLKHLALAFLVTCLLLGAGSFLLMEGISAIKEDSAIIKENIENLNNNVVLLRQINQIRSKE